MRAYGLQIPSPRRQPKYRNVATGGNASKREHKRGGELKLLLKAGKITDLEEQRKWELIPAQYDSNGKCVERAVTYTCDYAYRDERGELIVEDCKGVRTQQYVIRRKLMLWVHGIAVKEV